MPCLAWSSIGFALLAVGGSRAMFVVSALVFGTGFGSAYPLFLGHVMRHVAPERRGAAFGSIIAAFDTGIGTGSMVIGWLVQHYGYRTRLRRGGGAGAADRALLPDGRAEGAAAGHPGPLVERPQPDSPSGS